MALHGSKHFDPMLGVDFHEYIAPPGVWPTPHISLVLDLFDYLPLIGATVSIHGLQRTTAGTEGKSFHIPIGTPSPSSMDEFLKPEAEVFMGSRTVTADGDPLARMVVPTLSCNIAGIIPPFRPKKAVKTFSMTLPLTVNLALPHKVTVGGPLTISLMAMAMKAGFAVFKIGGKLVKKSQRFQDVMSKFKKFRQDTFESMDSGFLKCKVLRAEPVDIRNGGVQVVQRDFMLPGRVPLDWCRHYSSSDADHEGVLGLGWRTLMDTRLCLVREGNFRILMLADGPLLFPDTPQAAGKVHAVFSIPASARLWFEEEGGKRHWYAETEENLFWRFEDDGDSTELYPVALEDNNGNGWHFSSGSNLFTLTEYTRHGVTGRQVLMVLENRRISRILLEDSKPDNTDGKLQPHPLTTYSYDDENRLESQTDNVGHSLYYAWHQAGYMRYHADRLGQRFHYDYDDDWRVIHAWGDGGYYDYRFVWNDSSHELVMTNSLGHESIIRFSEDRLPLCEIDPQGGATFYHYDGYGLTTGVTSPGGGKTSWEYDEMGRVCRETTADNSQWSAVWQDNHLTEYCSKTGGKWIFRYDAAGNLSETHNPAGVDQFYHYDNLGQLERLAYGTGNDTLFSRDRLGFIRCVTHRNGSHTWYEWNNRGNLCSETNELRQQKRYILDACGRLVQALLPGGKSVHITYDAEGQITQYLDQAGRKTSLTYSPTGEVTSCTKPDGTRISYEYDTEDQLTAVCNELEQRWIIHRDSLGRIVEESNWRGQSTHYSWNSDDWLMARTTPDGNSLSYRYDRSGQITGLYHGDTMLTRYAWNAQGQMTGCDNPYRRLQWAYDDAGRLTEECQDAFSVRHFYTEQGQYAGRQSSSGNRVGLKYDDAGQLSQIQINDTPPVVLEYNILGMPVMEHLTDELLRELRYNEEGQLTAQLVNQKDAPLFAQEWRYDRYGNISSHSDSLSGETLFDYDITGQLTQYTDVLGRVQRFIYDAAGNRLREEIQKRDVPGQNDWLCHAWSTDEGNSLHHWYNRNGQLIKRERRENEYRGLRDSLLWDEQGQLKRYQSDQQTTEYGYDGLGRRVFKKTTLTGDNVSDIRWFWWDADNLLGETREQNETSENITQACELKKVNSDLVRRAYLREQVNRHNLQEYVYYPHTFEPFALITGSRERKTSDDRATCPARSICFYHNNINGSPLRLTNVKGEIVWSVQAGAWGDNSRISEDRVYNPLRYQGQYFDEESGLHYNRYRYYEPESGRFISQDPIGLAGGINTYAYAPNPLSYIDPMGLTSCNLAKLGEDLYVGTYNQVRRGNIMSGLNSTHTPHHAIQDAASPTTHGRGITINLPKDLHELTWTFKKPMVPGLTRAQRLAVDVKDLRGILLNAGYDESVINRQLGELIRKNRELWRMLEQ